MRYLLPYYFCASFPGIRREVSGWQRRKEIRSHQHHQHHNRPRITWYRMPVADNTKNEPNYNNEGVII